jgi:hypothetical protein
LIGAGAGLLLAGRAIRPPALAATRAATWAPNLSDLVEWRYAAGRITTETEDFGFIVSLSEIRVPFLAAEQLLVQRKNLNGDQAFSEHVYTGSRSYDEASATYTFKDQMNQTLATWQWAETNGLYHLSVATPELSLANVDLRPQGPLIAEAGDGQIQAGRINGRLLDSDYHADWTTIELAGQNLGVARLDMQGLRLSAAPVAPAQPYAHYWFALALELAGGSPAWLSAWRIEDVNGPYWAVTIASGSNTTWQIEQALHEGNNPAPLQVEVLAWQEIPNATPPAPSHIGQSWRLTGPNDLLNLTLTVPPGQFSGSGSPYSGVGGSTQLLESVGLAAGGAVLGQAITTVKLVVAESTAEMYRHFLPAIIKP